MRKHSLRQMANRFLQTDNTGSPLERQHRNYIIHKMIEDLFIIGDVPARWETLTADHIQKLIKLWLQRKMNPVSIMKYMKVIRDFLLYFDHHLKDIDNQSLGLVRKIQRKKKTNLTANTWQNLSNPISCVLLGLQTHFGLTLTEAMRLIPDIHIQKNALWITREIAFNSRDRFIPFRTQTQQIVLNQLIQLTGKLENLITAQGYDVVRSSYRETLKKFNLSSRKTFRYLYAQQLKQQLGRDLGSYQLHILIMEEMGLDSRTTLWGYLHE